MNWRNVLIKQDTPIIQAIQIIDAGAIQIALVVDENERLLGTVTDGDIRRGILKGIPLNESVKHIMNDQPKYVFPDESPEKMLAFMRAKRLNQVPIIDKDRRIIGIKVLNELLRREQKENWVILMAGGLGSRLQPLTDDCPKPLLKVGSKPLLETIIENFVEQNFYKFFLSVNYKAEMIKEYFGNGSQWGVELNYLHENKRLGTAGALSLLPGRPDAPIIVMNGDLLTKVNFNQLLEFHVEHRAAATMCVREYDFQVPYGVVRTDNQRLVSIEEKPTQHFFVSAGIYVLETDVLDKIPGQTYFDMPSLFEKLVNEQIETVVYPIREYWLDIGRITDFERANVEFAEVFG
ncbi:nucleotidyltransferase family protein [Brevibacillus sp. B_LB10_24]|uniref:nucleotidyltransferase family protein n=1 Tax=Brevibacillus sp. B_LB10_24 TaxID=3380645 RepID=UPI0038B9887A